MPFGTLSPVNARIKPPMRDNGDVNRPVQVLGDGSCGLNSSCIGTGNQPPEARGAQCSGRRRLAPPKIGEMRVPDAGITAGNRNHTVEIGLPWRIKITLILSSSCGKHEKKPKHFGLRAVEPKTELRRLALERACWDAI